MSEMHSPSKNIVVVGAGGRLGRAVVERFQAAHHVIGFDHKQLDLGSPDSIKAALGGLDYDLLFLTGALTAVDYCETHEEEAMAVNGSGPGLIAEISAAKGAHVTYISTDFVFDGMKSGPYLETDATHPISVYGASKLAGEHAVAAAGPDHLIARVSWVFGPHRPAFPEWIIGKGCAENRFTLPGDKTGCPTYTVDLAGWLEALVFRPEGPVKGVFHLCNSSPCTWRDWGQHCLETARDSGIPIIAEPIEPVTLDSVAAFVAKRPANSAMSTEKFTLATGIRPRDWQAALRDFVVQSESFSKYKLAPQSP